jgi:hypothetical protein
MPAGDLGPLWLNELRPRWRTSRAPVIGLSRQLTLFQLEQLAWDERWRVSTRVQHLRTASGRYIHKLAAATGQPRIMLRGATMLPGSDSQWGAAALDLMLSGSRAGQRGLPEPLGPWRGSADDNLFSWLIEARPRAALI